jgi:hypothetical protein
MAVVVTSKVIGYKSSLQHMRIDLSEDLARPAMQPRVMSRGTLL